jgi:hypothetical protein
VALRRTLARVATEAISARSPRGLFHGPNRVLDHVNLATQNRWRPTPRPELPPLPRQLGDAKSLKRNTFTPAGSPDLHGAHGTLQLSLVSREAPHAGQSEVTNKLRNNLCIGFFISYHITEIPQRGQRRTTQIASRPPAVSPMQENRMLPNKRSPNRSGPIQIRIVPTVRSVMSNLADQRIMRSFL